MGARSRRTQKSQKEGRGEEKGEIIPLIRGEKWRKGGPRVQSGDNFGEGTTISCQVHYQYIVDTALPQDH